MATPINTIYSWFETGDFPTQEQFHASWSSFWHKDETIPMTTIDGLSDQFGKYVLVSTFNSHLNDENAHSTYLAKRDASNLTPTNVNDWKAKLGVGDLPENIATYDYDIHNQVMMKDGTTKEATDLGKNVANSSLTSVAGAGLTLGSSWTLNTNGQLYSVTNLPDKSADISFNKMMVQNSTGQVAWGNGNTLIKNMPALLSEAEKTTWKTEMNGGWTTNTMSVAFITPFVIKRMNSNQFIAIHGVNLNFNPSNFSIKIIDDITSNILATVPNNQVQLVSNTQIILYFNFNSLSDGNYRLLLNNGVANYTTNSKILLTSTVNNINTSLLTWEINTVEPSPNTHGSGSSATIQDDSPSTVATNTPITTIKSSAIGQAGDNIYLDISFSIRVGTKSGDSMFDVPDARIGICYDDFNTGSNVFGHLSWFGYRPYSGRITFRLNNLTYIDSLTDGMNSYNDRLIIIKQDNLLTTILFNKTKSISTTINDEKGLSILMQLANWRDNLDNTATLNINEAYTF